MNHLKPFKLVLGLVAVLAAAVLMARAARRTSPTAVPGGSSPVRIVRLAAASDLRYALDDLAAEFRRGHPGVDLTVTYGSSGNFYAQLLNHAPFDLFLSADIEYPRQLAGRGLTLPDAEFTYAVGRIVLWVPAASTVDVERLGMKALIDPSISRVAIANPQHAPYGRAAESAMRTAGVLDGVRPKLVFGENIAQTLQFVQSGSADIGIVALSLAVSPTVVKAGRYVEVPLESYPRLEQGGTILRWASHPGAARAFRAFLSSTEARAVLERYGFLTSEAAPQTDQKKPGSSGAPSLGRFSHSPATRGRAVLPPQRECRVGGPGLQKSDMAVPV